MDKDMDGIEAVRLFFATMLLIVVCVAICRVFEQRARSSVQVEAIKAGLVQDAKGLWVKPQPESKP